MTSSQNHRTKAQRHIRATDLAGKVKDPPLPRVHTYHHFVAFMKQEGIKKRKPMDYILFIEDRLGHQERTKWWRFKRKFLSQHLAKDDKVRLMNWNCFRLYFYFVRHMTMENDIQYWVADILKALPMSLYSYKNSIRRLEKLDLITRTKSRGGWRQVWVCVNPKFYSYYSDMKQQREMYERVKRRQAAIETGLEHRSLKEYKAQIREYEAQRLRQQERSQASAAAQTDGEGR